MWKFENIPEEKHNQVIENWDNKDYHKLIEIYNEYNVAPDQLQDCCGYEHLKAWTNYAIQTQIITRHESATKT